MNSYDVLLGTDVRAPLQRVQGKYRETFGTACPAMELDTKHALPGPPAPGQHAADGFETWCGCWMCWMLLLPLCAVLLSCCIWLLQSEALPPGVREQCCERYLYPNLRWSLPLSTHPCHACLQLRRRGGDER